jgi:alkylhydroperoxidase/carboxymuconolactone decarboxylase family protein YurZ
MVRPMNELSITDLRADAEALTSGLPAGEALDGRDVALVTLAAAAAVTSLDRSAVAAAIAQALKCGASIAQVQEMIVLASGLGVHSLMVSSATVLEQAAARGLADPDAPLDRERQRLWDRYVGDDPFWAGFTEELPGFLEAMLRLSPDIFAGFFDYCAIPWRSGTVPAKVKELAALACDAAPSHRFGPGFRVHLKNAIKLGVGRTAIFQALDIAAAAPEHRGTR